MTPIAAVRADLARLKWHVAAMRLQVAMHRHAIVLKAGFNPDQPRVPAGNPDGGQWTSGGGAGGGRQDFEGDLGGDEDFEPTDISGVRRRPLPPIENPSDIPSIRPQTQQRINQIAREISRNPYLAFYYLITIAESTGHWLNEKYAEIRADQDPPKTLDELHDAVSRNEKRGYDIHHIVEQTAAKKQGFSKNLIGGRDNLVLIPRYRHWEINSWYQTPNKTYGGATPREYLQGKSWDEHRNIGIDALHYVGVLKP